MGHTKCECLVMLKVKILHPDLYYVLSKVFYDTTRNEFFVEGEGVFGLV